MGAKTDPKEPPKGPWEGPELGANGWQRGAMAAKIDPERFHGVCFGNTEPTQTLQERDIRSQERHEITRLGRDDLAVLNEITREA